MQIRHLLFRHKTYHFVSRIPKDLARQFIVDPVFRSLRWFLRQKGAGNERKEAQKFHQPVQDKSGS